MIARTITAAAVAAVAFGSAHAQDASDPDRDKPYVPSPPNEPVALADVPRELKAAVLICYEGGMVPDAMAEQAVKYDFTALSSDELASVAPDAVGATGFRGWADGDADDDGRVRVVTYLTEYNAIPHVVCIADAVTPQPEATFDVLSRALGAPRREVWKPNAAGVMYGSFAWIWEENGRYAMAEYTVREDGTDAALTVKASALQ